jgi:hypothetical protein
MKTKKMKYRVVGYDSFSREEFPVGEYETKEQALAAATKDAGTMTLMYVYDIFSGERISKMGTY